MDLNKIPIFGMLTEKMSWLGRRQRVLAENVANADTPGYQAKDIEKPDFGELLSSATGQGLQLKATQSGHLAGTATGNGDHGQSFEGTEASPSGNSVDLPMEMMKMGETQMEYATTASLYRKHVKLIKTALGKV
ncbi:MAG: flagellar basal body rod protein FlgB [Sphingomonadales bacterium]